MMEIEEIEKIILETFKNSCDLIVKEELKDHEFEFSKRCILNFIEYFSQKRRENGIL
jgi:hypothetical protein